MTLSLREQHEVFSKNEHIYTLKKQLRVLSQLSDRWQILKILGKGRNEGPQEVLPLVALVALALEGRGW